MDLSLSEGGMVQQRRGRLSGQIGDGRAFLGRSRTSGRTETSVKTLDRVVEILDSFTRERSTWQLADLAQHLEMPKGTMHRFLVALVQHGILQRDERDRSYSPGYKLWLWGNLTPLEASLRQVAHPILASLAAESGESALLTVYREGEVLCLDKVESDHPVRMTIAVGARRLPHAGASSKVLLAYLPEAEVEAVIEDTGLPKLCKNTITGPQALRAELRRIRELGYATSSEETDDTAYGVAVPVFAEAGTVIAGLGIAGPLTRFSRKAIGRHIEAAQRAAAQLSSLLGHAEPTAPAYR